MTQKQRYAQQDRARTSPPAFCRSCGTHVQALPMWAAIEAFDDDDSFDFWCIADTLTQMQAHTGPDAPVTFCQHCIAFESVSRDGTPTWSVIS